MKLKAFVLITLGTALMAAAVNIVYEPLNMVTGGFSGIGILIKELSEDYFPVPVWLTNAVLNLPLFFIAYKKFGKQFIGCTLYGTAAFTVSLSLIPVFPVLEKDYILAALTGGILTGAGIGLVFLTGSSTGGVDLLACLLHERSSVFRVSQYLVITDTIIVLSGALIFGVRLALYAVIAVFVSGRVMDFVLEGGHAAKVVYIVAKNNRLISQEIIKNLNRGVTALPAVGVYTGKSREMLFVVVGRRELRPLTEIIKSLDKEAFMIIQDASEVRGEGFLELYSEKP